MQKKSICADDLSAINEYSDMVYRLAFSMVKNKSDAEDIHQDVFIKYITKHPKFGSKEHEKAWFLRVTINLCKNLWMAAWRRKIISMEEYEHEERIEEESEDSIIDSVKRLPLKYRSVIHLFYYEDMSVEEISAVLKEKPSTVRTQLTRAREKLKEILKEDIDV